MLSKAGTIYDYRDVDLSAFQVPFRPDGEQIEGELKSLRNRYTSWEEGTTVREGDMAVCTMTSQNPGFQKQSVRLIVGSGLFHRELERAMVGMNAGETRTILLQEDEVAVTVEKVTARVVPELTGRMVEGLGLAGVQSPEDYRAYLKEQQRKEFAADHSYDAIRYVLAQVAEKSDLILKKADWDWLNSLQMGRYRALARQEGLVLEDMEAEDFDGKIPVRSYHELMALVQNEGWERLSCYVLGLACAGQEGFAVTEEDYGKFLKEYAESWHVTEEMARESNPWESYAADTIIDYYYGKVAGYVESVICREEEPV